MRLGNLVFGRVNPKIGAKFRRVNQGDQHIFDKLET